MLYREKKEYVIHKLHRFCTLCLQEENLLLPTVGNNSWKSALFKTWKILSHKKQVKLCVATLQYATTKNGLKCSTKLQFVKNYSYYSYDAFAKITNSIACIKYLKMSRFRSEWLRRFSTETVFLQLHTVKLQSKVLPTSCEREFFMF